MITMKPNTDDQISLFLSTTKKLLFFRPTTSLPVVAEDDERLIDTFI